MHGYRMPGFDAGIIDALSAVGTETFQFWLPKHRKKIATGFAVKTKTNCGEHLPTDMRQIWQAIDILPHKGDTFELLVYNTVVPKAG